jgi:hypothetical protein
MPDFTVIEGGGGKDEDGPKDWRVLNAGVFAEEQFEQLTIEILRAVARGTDAQRRVSGTIKDLFHNLQLSERPVSPLVEEGIRRINVRLVPEEFSDYDHDLGWLLSAALRLAAERVATDGFARGRASQRLADFKRAMEDYLIVREERSREYGGSYLTGLLARLPPIERPKPNRKQAKKSKARRHKSANRPSIAASAATDTSAAPRQDWRASALGQYERQVLFALIRRGGGSEG